MAAVTLNMTGKQANDLRLLCGVAKTLTLPLLVATTDLTSREAAQIAERVEDLEVTLHKALS